MSACVGASSTISTTTEGGLWSSSNSSTATVVGTTGVVTGVAAGTITLTYMMPTGCYRTATFTVLANPGTITGTTTVCVGSTTTLSNSVSGGTWSSSNTGVGTI